MSPSTPRGFPLRPLSFGEILDGGIRIWRDHLRVLFPFVAVLLLPFQVLIALLQTSAEEAVVVRDAASVSANPTVDITWTGIAALLVSLVVGIVAGLFIAAAITSFVGEAVLGRTPDTRSARQVAVRRLLPSLGVVLLNLLALVPVVGLVVVAAVVSPWLAVVVGIAATVAAIWWFVATNFAAPIVVLEHAGPVVAIKRSMRLVRGRWWFLFGIAIVSGLMTSIPAGIITAVISGLLGALGGGNAAFDFMWAAIGGTIGTAIFTPMSSAITVIAYLDRRVRTEGFDLQRLATSLGTELPPPPQWSPPGTQWSPPPAPWAPPGAGAPPGPAGGPPSWQVPQPSSSPLPPPPTTGPWAPPVDGSAAPPAPPWAAPPAPGEPGAPAAGAPSNPPGAVPSHVLPPVDTPPGMWAPPPGAAPAAPGSAGSSPAPGPSADAPAPGAAPWASPVEPGRDGDR